MSILDNEEVLIQCLADEYKVLQQCIYKSYIYSKTILILMEYGEDCWGFLKIV